MTTLTLLNDGKLNAPLIIRNRLQIVQSYVAITTNFPRSQCGIIFNPYQPFWEDVFEYKPKKDF